MKNLDQRKFLREKEVSEIYGINKNTLRRQRWGDYGIPFRIFNRKKGKLPADTFSQDFVLEYGKSTIEVHKDSINNNDSVLIIDDLIATGGTAEAAAKLVEKSGGKVAGFIFVINLYDVGGIIKLKDKGYEALSLMEFPGH